MPRIGIGWRGTIRLLLVFSPTLLCLQVPTTPTKKKIASKIIPSTTTAVGSVNTSDNNNNPQRYKKCETRRESLEGISKKMLFSLSSCSIALIDSFKAAHALTPQEAATAYDSYAESYDQLDGGKAADILGIDQARRILFRQARGSVLEIGVGTGLNLEKYIPSRLESLTLVDISEGMLRESKKRIQNIPSLEKIPLRLIQADATTELIDRFGNEKFDTVVDSFSFCVMGTQGARNCLDQMKHVVKSKKNNGQILLLENTRSSNPLFGLYQDATAETAASDLLGGKGCVYNQDVTKLIQASSIEIVREDQYANGFFRSFQCQVL